MGEQAGEGRIRLSRIVGSEEDARDSEGRTIAEARLDEPDAVPIAPISKVTASISPHSPNAAYRWSRN